MAAIKNIVDDVMVAPMNRKEFLGRVGALLLAVIGVTSVLHALSGQNRLGVGSSSSTNPGAYGSSRYGGI